MNASDLLANFSEKQKHFKGGHENVEMISQTENDLHIDTQTSKDAGHLEYQLISFTPMKVGAVMNDREE